MEWQRGLDLSIILGDEPGQVTALARAAKQEGIEISGTCGFLWGTHPIIHVAVIDDDARDTLENAGFDVRAEQEVLLVTMGDTLDAVEEVTAAMAKHGINLDLLYLGGGGCLVLGVDDFHRAQSVLQAGWV